MTKYLIFKNDIGIGKTPPIDSPEYVACDIARTVGWDGFPVGYFAAFAAKTSDATFATLKGPPKFSMVLDKKKVSLWQDELRPMRDEIEQVQTVIDGAYSAISQAVRDLDQRCQLSTHFAKNNLAAEISIDAGFGAMDNYSHSQFCDLVSELYDIEIYQPA